MLTISQKIPLLKSQRVAFLFLVCEIFLFLAFLFIDLFRPELPVYSSYIKLSSILFCLIFRFFLHYRFKGLLSVYLLLALLFTTLADIFFLLTDKMVVGIFFFIIVQLAYRLHLRRKKAFGDILMITIGFFIGILSVHFILRLPILPTVVLIPIFYFLFLLYNNFTSWRELKQCGKLFSLGLLLLLLCDIQVGFNGFKDYLHLSPNRITIPSYNYVAGIWGFYLPSQLCIVFADLPIILKTKRDAV